MNWEYVNRLQKSCAFIPCYQKGTGKVTKMLFKDGSSEYTSYSIDKVINDYFDINMRSISSIKRYCTKITGKKSITPLFIEKECVFIPVKTIKPCTRGDKCLGYVNTEYIESIDFLKQNIILKNGCYINFMDSSETLKKRIADCAIIKQNLSLGDLKSN